MTDWLIRKEFTMHSGEQGHFKIECEALTDIEIETFAWFIADHYKDQSIGEVVSVPRGGDRIRDAVAPYFKSGTRRLIVDDVLTTGRSMLEARQSPDDLGAVLFSRIRAIPEWIYPVFILGG